MSKLDTFFNENIFNKIIEKYLSESDVKNPSLNKFAFDKNNKETIDYYSYKNFINAFKIYPDFGNTGDIETCKKEVAALFANIALESGFMYSREIFVNIPYYNSDFESVYPGCSISSTYENKYLVKDKDGNPIKPKIDWGRTEDPTKTATYTTLPKDKNIRESSSPYYNSYKSYANIVEYNNIVGYKPFINNRNGCSSICPIYKKWGNVIDGKTVNIDDMAIVGLEYGYYGRGPSQLSWNFNYGPFGKDLYDKLKDTEYSTLINNDPNYVLNNPDIVAQNGMIGALSSIWFWFYETKSCNDGNGNCNTCTASNSFTMKPSPHQIMTGSWTPTSSDITNNRLANFGSVIDIINGPMECSSTSATWAKESRNNRIKYYKQFCEILGVTISDSELTDINKSCGDSTTPWEWSCTNPNTTPIICNK